MEYWNGFPLIDDGTPDGDLFDVLDADGQATTRGCVPRDYTVQPLDFFAPPRDMAVIPRSEWDARIDQQEQTQSSLEHLYLRGANNGPQFVNLDQNGNGYCWAYSVGHCIMLARLRDNQPLIRLNPHGPAAIIKRGADQGGWCGLSAQFAREHGYPVEGTGAGQWPLHSRDLRRDTPELRAAMRNYVVTEDWVDLMRPVYSQNLTMDQIATCLLCNQPCALDFSWWGHSVCGVRKVKVEAGSYGTLILNSWKGWGRHGLGILRGEREKPMGAVCMRVVRAAPLLA
jgi:hypothetical protein